MLLVIAILVLYVVSLWKIFERAGQPGWACWDFLSSFDLVYGIIQHTIVWAANY
jgi:hypothetical protein